MGEGESWGDKSDTLTYPVQLYTVTWLVLRSNTEVSLDIVMHAPLIVEEKYKETHPTIYYNTHWYVSPCRNI